METQPYFCGNQLVQKNCSFFVLSSDLPGQQPAQSRRRVAAFAEWARGSCPLPGHFCEPALCHVPPRAPHPSLAGVIPQTFSSDYASTVLGASSLNLLIFLGCSSKNPGEGTSTHTSLQEPQQSCGTSLASEGTMCCLTTSFHGRQVSLKFSLMLKIAALSKRELMGLPHAPACSMFSLAVCTLS